MVNLSEAEAEMFFADRSALGFNTVWINLLCATYTGGRADGSTFFQFALRFYNEHGPVVPGTTSLWDEYQEWKKSPKGQAAQHGGLIGSPDTIRAKLRKFDATNVDQVILLNQAGRNRHDHICEALELFAREVMPEFHEREGAHQEWKRGVLEGRIELEEIDTTPYNLPSNQTPASKLKAQGITPEAAATAAVGD